jgi:hypothetical protein
MAVVAGQEVALLARFHALGDHRQPQAAPQGDDGAHDGGVVGVGQHVAHKGLVDLELIQRQALEVAQAGVAGAEIVEREAHAQGLEQAHALR